MINVQRRSLFDSGQCSSKRKAAVDEAGRATARGGRVAVPETSAITSRALNTRDRASEKWCDGLGRKMTATRGRRDDLKGGWSPRQRRGAITRERRRLVTAPGRSGATTRWPRSRRTERRRRDDLKGGWSPRQRRGAITRERRRLVTAPGRSGVTALAEKTTATPRKAARQPEGRIGRRAREGARSRAEREGLVTAPGEVV